MVIQRANHLTIRNPISGLYHICIGLLPVIYVVYVPGLNIGLGTVILLLFIPYACWFILNHSRNYVRISPFIFLLFYVYLIFRADGNTVRIIMCVASFINLWGMMKGSISSNKIRKVVEVFSLINVWLLLVQIIGYYILHTRLQFIPQNLIYEEYRNSYVFTVADGIYRPSALFLEPSHFSQFCIFALISSLFPQAGNVNAKRAILLGLGCILTTSGMGIALTFGVFAWYLILNRDKINSKILRVFKLLPFFLIGLFVLSRTEFFRVAVQRVFVAVDGYNAITGRTHNWGDTIGNMHGKLLWLGYGDSKQYRWYLTGLADSIYKYGIICVVLEALCLIQLMLKKIDNYVWCCCIVFAGLFCVAHLTNFFAQVFYFGIVISDAIVRREKNQTSSIVHI